MPKKSSAEPEPKANATELPPWLGLDIGGANIKAAHTSGWNANSSFPMWKQPFALARTLVDMLLDCPAFSGVAVTMTGELADCFLTRAEGVAVIVEQITSCLPAHMVAIYCVDGKWRKPSQAVREPWLAAASNWHGLTRWASRYAPAGQSCLLIDVGSTTSDLIPIEHGTVGLEGYSDSQRMQCGGLVYTGVERSNASGIVQHLPLHGSPCPVMNELFATTRDVYLWLNELPDAPECNDTADGRPATREASRYRLARLVGEDGSTLADSDIDKIANEIHMKQASMLSSAMGRVVAHNATLGATSDSAKKSSKTSKTPKKNLAPFESVILSGHGDFLIDAALALHGWDGLRIRLSECIGAELARAAPAYAVAVLASEELGAVPQMSLL